MLKTLFLFLFFVTSVSTAGVKYTLNPYFEAKGAYDTAIPIPDTVLFDSIALDTTVIETSSFFTTINSGAILNVQVAQPLLLQLGYDFLWQSYDRYKDGNFNQHAVDISGRYVVLSKLLFKGYGGYAVDQSKSIFYKSNGIKGGVKASYIFPHDYFSQLDVRYTQKQYPDLVIDSSNRYDYLQIQLQGSLKKYLKNNSTVEAAGKYELRTYNDAPIDTNNNNQEDEAYGIKAGYLYVFKERALLKVIGDFNFNNSNDSAFINNDYEISTAVTYSITKTILIQLLGKYQYLDYPHRKLSGTSTHQTDNRFTGSLEINGALKNFYVIGLSYFVQKNDSSIDNEDYLRNIILLSLALRL